MMNLKNNWKMYVSLVLYALLGLAIGYGVAKGVMHLMKRDGSVKQEEVMATSTAKYSGSVVAIFEGENKVNFSFDHDKKLSVNQGAGNLQRYFYVKEGEKNVGVVYFSYEGGRGYSASDYIAEVISPKVSGLSAPSTMAHGSMTWMHVATAGTDWHVMPINDGEWLVIVESAKANKDLVKSVFESFKATTTNSMMMSVEAKIN